MDSGGSGDCFFATLSSGGSLRPLCLNARGSLTTFGIFSTRTEAALRRRPPWKSATAPQGCGREGSFEVSR
eukprot:scaffold78898_cov60-Phaeocystis_antarctica.AAC.2